MKKKYIIPSANVANALSLRTTLSAQSNYGTDDDPGAKRRGNLYDETDGDEQEIWSTKGKF